MSVCLLAFSVSVSVSLSLSLLIFVCLSLSLSFSLHLSVPLSISFDLAMPPFLSPPLSPSSLSQDGEVGLSDCRYVSTALDVEAVYAHLYRQYTSSPHNMDKVPFISSSLLGSPGLRKVSAELAVMSVH